MPEEVNDANNELETSQVQDENVDPSTTEAEETAEQTQLEDEATSQQAVETPFHEHPRWKEIQEEKRQAQEDKARAEAEAQYYRGLAEASKKPEVTADPLSGVQDPEVQRWIKENIIPVVDHKVKAARQEEREAVQKELNTYRSMVGSVIGERFLDKHPEVSKGSPEMKAIYQKAQAESALGKELNQALEDAYKVTMFDKNAQMAVEKEKRKVQTKIKEKQAANVETAGVSKGIPKKTDTGNDDIVEDDFAKAAKELGYVW